MLDGVLNSFPDAAIEVLVVWIAMMHGDTFESARKAALKFEDGRVAQFFDPGHLAGRTVAKSLGYDGETAWDFYLFYPARSLWRDLPPAPKVFMHQLPNSWAERSCLFEKDRLRDKLSETMKRLFP